MPQIQITHWRPWEQKFEQFLHAHPSHEDVAHDVRHIRRVVRLAKSLAQKENARTEIVIPAAWLHDCVLLPKHDPHRASASSWAAQKAIEFLNTIQYPSQYLEAIFHAIEAHSFRANICPQTIEAMVVQDADRLDSLGAIGIARVFAVSGQLHQAFYDECEPFPLHRQADDAYGVLDHFYVKLFKIANTLTTQAGRQEGVHRTQFMERFLTQFRTELGVMAPSQNTRRNQERGENTGEETRGLSPVVTTQRGADTVISPFEGNS